MPGPAAIDKELHQENTPPDFESLEQDQARVEAGEDIDLIPGSTPVVDFPADDKSKKADTTGEEESEEVNKTPEVKNLAKTPAPAKKVNDQSAVKISSNKKTDVKPTAKSDATVPGDKTKPEAKTTAKAAATEEGEEADPEVDAIQLDPKYANPILIGQFKQLRKYTKAARKEVRELKPQLDAAAKEIATLKQAPRVLPEEIKLKDARIKELEHYQYLLNPQNSAFVTKEYDDKLTAANTAVYNVLKKYKIGEAKTENKDGQEMLSIDFIKRAGGITGLDYQWWEETVLAKMQPLDRELIKQELISALKLEDGKRDAIAAAGPKREALLKESQAQRETQLTSAKARVDELIKQHEYAQKKEIPITATDEERVALEKHNEFVDYAERLFPILMEPPTMNQRVDVAAGFIHALHLENVLQERETYVQGLEAQLAALTEELDGIKNAGSTRTEVLPSNNKPKPLTNADYMHRSAEDNFKLLEGEE